MFFLSRNWRKLHYACTEKVQNSAQILAHWNLCSLLLYGHNIMDKIDTANWSNTIFHQLIMLEVQSFHRRHWVGPKFSWGLFPELFIEICHLVPILIIKFPYPYGQQCIKQEVEYNWTSQCSAHQYFRIQFVSIWAKSLSEWLTRCDDSASAVSNPSIGMKNPRYVTHTWLG